MNLNQFFTPTWAAELLIAQYFPDLQSGDIVVDPTCGDGRFLMALPSYVDAYGVEIDRGKAVQASINSGRQVIAGDFMHVDLPRRPSLFTGNPPFVAETIDAIMEKCYEELEYEGRVGFILPVYYFNYPSKVVDMQRRWSIAQDLLPRTLFSGLSFPILFARFIKQRRTTLSGFFLYAERHALDSLKADIKRLLIGNHSGAYCWRDVVGAAIKAMGGRANLQQLYAAIEGNRPTENKWWREKVRQTAAKHYVRLGVGEYGLNEQVPAFSLEAQ